MGEEVDTFMRKAEMKIGGWTEDEYRAMNLITCFLLIVHCNICICVVLLKINFCQKQK